MFRTIHVRYIWVYIFADNYFSEDYNRYIPNVQLWGFVYVFKVSDITDNHDTINIERGI